MLYKEDYQKKEVVIMRKFNKRKACVVAVTLLVGLMMPLSTWGQVRCWTEDVKMPTYPLGPEEKHPIFKDYRLPGGSPFWLGRQIYPYTLENEYTNTKKDVVYKGVYLENEYIKVLVMPELRGRIWGAIDKRNGWDFIYYNPVVKSADVAIRGAWISTGVEWNHPGGHAYTTYDDISYKIMDEPDGGKTVLIAEIEPNRMHKWEIEVTLRPGRLFLEIHGRLMSIKSFPVPIVSAQNLALHATENSQVIYPKDTWATGHGKKIFIKWPMHNGVDFSRYKNIETLGVSTFADGPALNQDYFGAYAHDKNAGTVIYADHRTVPGKKQWYWGSGRFAKVWNYGLSDSYTDGPYELHLIAFWDNLGHGYSWLNPLEVKEFTSYWYPIMDMGGFVKANKDLCLNMVQTNGVVELALQATSEFPDSRIEVEAKGKKVFNKRANLNLKGPFKVTFPLPEKINYEDLHVTVYDSKGEQILIYNTAPFESEAPETVAGKKPMPEMSLEELYQAGKSYYQDPFCPESEAYFQEMLRRDPGESHAHRALGILNYQRGDYEKAKKHLNKVLDIDHLNEEAYKAHIYLGLVALETGDLDDAREALMIASRYSSTKVTALFYLGRIEFLAGDYEKAVHYLEEAIKSGGYHPAIWSTMAIAYRKMGSKNLALQAIQNALDRDPLEFTALTEQWFWGEAGDNEINSIFDRKDFTFVGSQLYLEQAANYMELGEWQDAISLLKLSVEYFKGKSHVYPLLNYYLGYCHEQLGKVRKAHKLYKKASKGNPKYVFPYRKMSVKVLKAALDDNESDSNGWMYLGNVLTYLRQLEEGLQAWKMAEKLDPKNPILLRNISQATWHLKSDTSQAIAYLEKALDIAPNDPRIFWDLDHMYAFIRADHKHLNLFKKNMALVASKDFLVDRMVDLLIRLGQDAMFEGNHSKAKAYFKEAAELMDTTYFFTREAYDFLPLKYSEAHFGLGEALLKEGNPDLALEQFKKGLECPDNLNETFMSNPVYTRAHYLLGLANKKMGNDDVALEYFQKAAYDPGRPNTESSCYRGLALKELSKKDAARNVFLNLINLAKVSLAEKESPIQHFVISQAYRGLGDNAQAEKHLKIAIEQSPNVILQVRYEASHIPWEGGLGGVSEIIVTETY